MAYFNGSSYLTLPSSALHELNTASISYVIKKPAPRANDVVYFDGQTGSNQWLGILAHNGTANNNMRNQWNRGGNSWMEGNYNFQSNVWDYQVFAYTSTTRYFLTAGGQQSLSRPSGFPANDYHSIGARVRPGADLQFLGWIAEIATWNVRLTLADRDMLRYYAPPFVRPDNLLHYWPLLSDARDHHGDLHATEVGSISYGGDHPPLIRKTARSHLAALPEEEPALVGAYDVFSSPVIGR